MVISSFLSAIKRLGQIIRYWLWSKPVSKSEPPKATEVMNQYVVIDYKGQKVNLKKTELPLFNNLSRKDKRAMAKRFEIMEKKGQIRFEIINGQTIAIKEKNYAAKADIRQSRSY